MAGATTVTSGFQQGLDVKAWKYWIDSDTYQQEKAVVPLIYKTIPIDTLHYQCTSMVGTGDWRQFGENEDIPVVTPIESWIVYLKPEKWGKQEIVSHEVQKSFQKFDNFLKAQQPSWNEDYVRTKEKHGANCFNYGGFTLGHEYFNATVTGVQTDPYPLFIYDSSALYATNGTDDHVNKASQSYYNGLLTTPFSVVNLQAAWNLFTITNARDEANSIVDIEPDLLVYANDVQFTVEEVMTSTTRPDTGMRADNVMKSMLGNRLKNVPWRFIVTAGHWMLIKSSANTMYPGFIFLEKEAPRFKFWEDNNNENYQMSATSMYGAGVANWRFVVGCNYPTS